MKSSFSLAKVWFAFSLAALVFAYGVGVGTWEWFPHSFLDRALAQARVMLNAELDSKPKAFDRQGAKTYRPREMASGMTVVTSWWQTDDGPKVGMKLIDQEGKVLHEWLTGREGLIQDAGQQKGRGDTGLHGSILLPNGDVVVNQFYVGTARLNSCGETLWSLPEGSHHSVAEDEDGSFWITAVSQEKRDSYPGLGPVWVDRILHVSESGEIISDINTLDVLYENNLERILFQLGNTSGDVTHQNDVEPLPSSISDDYPLFNAGDLLVSPRNINLVFVFDPDTKDIKWYSRDPFIRQHDPDFIGDGWIGVFDNNVGRGRAMGMGSWIRAFQPHTDSTRVLFRPDRIDRFYTGGQGKWQNLKNGNMLLTEAETGRVIEVNPEGRIVWEWIHEPMENGRVPSVTKATRVNLTRKEVASWPCSSVDSVTTSTQKSAPQNQQKAR